MGSASKKIVWAFAVLGILSVALTFYTSVIMETFTVVYCDEDGACTKTMPDELLEEEVTTPDGVLNESTDEATAE